MGLVFGARDLALDGDGDLALENNDFTFLIEGEAIAQACGEALSLFRGEWFLDLDLGLPYYEEILIKSPSLIGIRGLYRNKLLEVAGVLGIVSLNTNYQNASRELSITWRVSTDFGEFSGEV